jgi:spore maturation protein CgeB
MKIVIFGLTVSSSWGNGHATPYRALLRGLRRLGHEVSFYEKDVEYYYWRRDFREVDYCNLVLYLEWREVRKRAIDDAAEADAVIVGSFCPEGARIADEVLALAKPVKVFYDLDTPVTLKELAKGDLDYLHRDHLSAYDLVLSFTGGAVLDELEHKWGARQARPLYGCVDPEVYHRVPPSADFACGLSYMGTHSRDREQKLRELFFDVAQQSPSDEFLLAGTMYPAEWKFPANVRRVDHVAPARHAEFYSSCRATLNLTRGDMAANGWCPSGRFFEAAACGTPLFSDWFPGLEDFFTDGEELRIVRSTEDVLAAMSLSDSELQQMARRARERTLEQHTGSHRATELAVYLEQLRSRISPLISDDPDSHLSPAVAGGNAGQPLP